MASDPGGSPHSRSGRQKEHPVLLCGPPSTALLLEAFLALGPSAARRALLKGCGCPRGPQAGLPCMSGLNPEETRAAAFHTAGRPGAPASCPALHQGAAQRRSRAARQPSRGLLPLGRHFAPTRELEPDFSPSRPRLLLLLARLPPSPGEETSTRTVAPQSHRLLCPGLRTSGPPHALEGGDVSSTRGTSHRSQHGRLVVRPRLPQDADSCPHALLFAWQPPNFPERRAQGPGTTVRPPAAGSAAGTPSSVVLAVSVGRPSHARRQGRVQPPRHSPDADETTPVAPRSQRADVGVPHGIPWSSGHFLNQLPEGRAAAWRRAAPRKAAWRPRTR